MNDRGRPPRALPVDTTELRSTIFSSLSLALRPALRGLSTNLVPGLILQAFALLVVLGYYQVGRFAGVLDYVGELKAQGGYGYSMASTALFGGVIPFLVLWGSGRVPSRQFWAQGAFYAFFWCWKGAEVDAFYRLQAWLIGSETTWRVIASKTMIDQFVYNPLWAAPTQTIFFLWKDSGFSYSQTIRSLTQKSLISRIVVITLSTWIVWIPAVAIIYSLPSALQIPLFNLVLCFWCLLLSFVSRSSTEDDS